MYESESWLYEGSYVLEKSSDIKAIVINTGFTTKRGRIIRKILNQVNKEPKIYRTALVFVVESGLIGVLAFGIYYLLIEVHDFEI